MADRVGVINKGEIVLVEDKRELMRKLGKKQLMLHLAEPLREIPPGLASYRLALSTNGRDLVYTYDTHTESSITALLDALERAGIGFKDLETSQSSLEDIFVDLVKKSR